jgi:hypothetical protein
MACPTYKNGDKGEHTVWDIQDLSGDKPCNDYLVSSTYPGTRRVFAISREGRLRLIFLPALEKFFRVLLLVFPVRAI